MSAAPTSVDLGFARVDVEREARQGLPEVVYGTGKTVEQIVAVVRTLLDCNSGAVLVTRVGKRAASAVLAAVPGGVYDAPARLLVWRPADPGLFRLAVVTAGTADGPVAAEAAAVAGAIGLSVDRVDDVGVAGLHRLLGQADRLRSVDAVVVVAGMEGALASAVGGLVAAPVIAVPTSTGYGAALEGVTALLAMLTSCAAGVTVVNIDSGFRRRHGSVPARPGDRGVIAVVDPFTGLAGDMFLAALLDVGAPLATVHNAVGSTGLTGWSLSAQAVDAHGLRAPRASGCRSATPPPSGTPRS